MSRNSFGGGAGDFAVKVVGTTLQVSPSAAVSMWSLQTGGTQYTDLKAADGVTSISTVTTSAVGAIPVFFGPDSVSLMWADAGGPARVKLLSDSGGGGGTFTGDFSGITGTISAAQLMTGLPVIVVWNGTVWKDLAGTTITARPTGRGDVCVMALLGTSPPSWLINDYDMWFKDNS